MEWCVNIYSGIFNKCTLRWHCISVYRIKYCSDSVLLGVETFTVDGEFTQ
jgi:hypothetical protein